MNKYLGIEQITTGSHNPRSNAVVERFMQHLNGCLTKCDDSQYKNMKDFLPAIAFAHNTAFNSAINCTPFEAGHGLRAKTITEARANPRLQITAEEGTDIYTRGRLYTGIIHFPQSPQTRRTTRVRRAAPLPVAQAHERTPP
jgi:hypothetical protein